MKTGEGKTLVSTLPAYLNGLSGKGVHQITTNDYLAQRDSFQITDFNKGMNFRNKLSTSIFYLFSSDERTVLKTALTTNHPSTHPPTHPVLHFFALT